MALTLTVEQKELAALTARLAAAVDGKVLRLELAAKLRAAVAPAVAEVKGGAMAIHKSSANPKLREISSSGREVFSSLGAAIAQGIGVQTRLTGRVAGVRVRATKKGMPRDFPNAPKRINAKQFRHRVFGRDVWVTQIGNPGFFDGPLHRDHVKYRLACRTAMDEMAAKLAK